MKGCIPIIKDKEHSNIEQFAIIVIVIKISSKREN